MMVVYIRVGISGKGCTWKIVKVISKIELIGYGEEGEGEGVFKIVFRFFV